MLTRMSRSARRRTWDRFRRVASHATMADSFAARPAPLVSGELGARLVHVS